MALGGFIAILDKRYRQTPELIAENSLNKTDSANSTASVKEEKRMNESAALTDGTYV